MKDKRTTLDSLKKKDRYENSIRGSEDFGELWNVRRACRCYDLKYYADINCFSDYCLARSKSIYHITVDK